MRPAALLSLPFALSTLLPAQGTPPAKHDDLFGFDKIWDIKIVVDEKGWRKLYPPGEFALRVSSFPYIRAKVTIAGCPTQEVGLRLKGKSTYVFAAGTLKRSFKIDFNRFDKKQKFLGLKKLNLNNNWCDATQIREAVSYKAYRDAGMMASRTAFARVFLTIKGVVDNTYLGLYTIVEQVDRGMFKRHLKQDGALFKPAWQFFSYRGDKWSSTYSAVYEPRTKFDPKRLQPIIDIATLMRDYKSKLKKAGDLPEQQRLDLETRFSTGLEKVFDVDVFLRYLAVSVIVGNEDSVLAFPHNYYLALPYETKKVVWVAWDLNNSLDGIGLLKSPDSKSRSILEPSVLPQIKQILSVRKYQKRYLEILKEQMEGACATQKLIADIQLAQRVTKDAIAQESKRLPLVMKAGDLGGPKKPDGIGNLGAAAAEDLIEFAKWRGGWVTKKLAAKEIHVKPAR